MNSNAKDIIRQTALSQGFTRVVFADLTPLAAERKYYENWLALGYGAGMAYLQANPEKRSSPALLFAEARSAVLFFASYYTEVPDDPGCRFGRVARYAVGQDYHRIIPSRLDRLKALLEEKLERPPAGRFFTDNVELFEQGLAARHGLGFTGRNSLLIGPQLSGSYHFIAEFFTDLPLEPDGKYEGTCGKCSRCRIACPTSAIVGDGMVDARRCISFLTIENKGGIPLELRKKVGSWVFGCDACQEVCPYNSRPPASAWPEFSAQYGAGHFLELSGLLKIKSNREFLARFGKTPLARAKRRGLIRNALVVMGNRLPEQGEKLLAEFLAGEENLMLLEHGLWALSCYENGRKLIEALYEKKEGGARELAGRYLDS